MLTMDDLTTGENPMLRPVEAAAGVRPRPGRAVEQVEVCDGGWRLPGSVTRARDLLVVVPGDVPPPDDPAAALRGLAERGVTAVVLTGPAAAPGPGRDRAVAAARAAGLPLLEPVLPYGAAEVQARVLHRLAGVLREGVGQRDRLLRLTARLDRHDKGPGRLLRHLEDECGAEVRLIAPGAPAGWEVLDGHRHLLAQVHGGRMHTAALSAEGRHVLLHAVGSAPPHPVLAAVRTEPWPRRLRTLPALAAGQLGLLHRPAERREAERRLWHTEMTLKVSILQYLMVGGVAAAVRAAEPLVPGVLTADSGRVAVVECASPGDRPAVVRECEKALGRRSLVVLCPAVDRHVIAILPHRTGDGPGAGGDGTAELLAPVVRASGMAAGIGSPGPWYRTAHCYDSAVRALAAARRAPRRTAVEEDGSPLVAFLPEAARRWAEALLGPLDGLPREQRDQLVHTARLTLSYGAASTARLVGVDRTTAGKRLALVMRQVGLGRARLADRAVLDLAFQLGDRLRAPGPSGVPEVSGGRPPHLCALLARSDEARQEAERFLAPLDAATRALLVRWIAADGVIGRAAPALGMHRNSLSQRLERAGALVGRVLTQPGGGCHDLLWALLLTGELPPEAVHDPVADGPRPA
ncbi:helix-turn-helix domain-containing protein [Streptomyces sp. URMC 125]|uniref:helix-turn-helix domain-containing protein n=1 Tax=Streptomyces sp. URMC 125 TaxID=3423419 RepID=UPI003F1C0154